MKQTKTKLIKLTIRFYVWTITLLMASTALAYGTAKTALFVLDPVKQPQLAEVNIIKEVKAETPEEDMRGWVLNEFKRNGLNPQIADCVIQQESRWDDQKPPSATNDYGLMQWNIQHIKSGLLNMSCAYNYRCAVELAIKKIKKDGNWNAWMGYRDANCQRLNKI